MRNTKRLVASVLSLGLMASLCACGSNNTTVSNVETTNEYSADVIIVGAGGAGMTAAIEATNAGASVIMIEKSSAVGGNTVATQSGINAVGTDVQDAAGFEYSEEEFIAEQTNDYTNADLVQFFADNSASAISWLESMGMEFSINVERNGYTHEEANGNTTALVLIDTLYSKVKENGATVVLNTTANSLIEEDGVVKGVKATDADGNEMTFTGNAVVLATGGYGQNSELVYENNASLTGAITDEVAPTTGEGMIMATEIGAATVDLDKFTTFPAVEVTTHQMIFPMYIPQNSIFVNAEGNRFVSEAFGDETTMNAMMQEDKVYVVFDQVQMENASVYQDLYSRGAVIEGATIEELATNMGVDASNLQSTVDTWNTDIAAGTDSVYGRDVSDQSDLTHSSYYAVEIGVGVHYCLGGLVINTDTQVLDTDGNAIVGLYAAGEVTGGVHGDNKVDGSTFADSIIFGRQTGMQSAAYALSQGTVEVVVPDTSKTEVEITSQGDFTDGVYEGAGTGRGGDLTVQVTVEGGNITDITILSNDETASIFEGVETNLIPAIISGQSLDVDVISGATLSSNGVLDAVADALGLTR